MEKLWYVCWRPPSLDEAAWSEHVLDHLVPALLELGAQHLAVTVPDRHTDPVRAFTIAAEQPALSGTASFWLDACDDRLPAEAVLAGACDRIAGYLVTESVVLDDGLPHDGRATPTIDLQGFLRPVPDLSHAEWVEHWFEEHRAVALETECVTSYARNLVARVLTPGAPPWAGFVDQHFASVHDLLDPVVRFRGDGDPDRSNANLQRMVESCAAFLDMAALDSHPLTQYRFA